MLVRAYVWLVRRGGLEVDLRRQRLSRRRVRTPRRVLPRKRRQGDALVRRRTRKRLLEESSSWREVSTRHRTGPQTQIAWAARERLAWEEAAVRANRAKTLRRRPRQRGRVRSRQKSRALRRAGSTPRLRAAA